MEPCKNFGPPYRGFPEVCFNKLLFEFNVSNPYNVFEVGEKSKFPNLSSFPTTIPGKGYRTLAGHKVTSCQPHDGVDNGRGRCKLESETRYAFKLSERQILLSFEQILKKKWKPLCLFLQTGNAALLSANVHMPNLMMPSQDFRSFVRRLRKLL